MITREFFVKTMEQLEETNNKMNAVDKAMQKLDKDFCSFYFPDAVSVPVDILTEALNDEDEWLNYFVWERSWLKDFELGDVIINGEHIDIKNWADVYDFIISENKRRFEESVNPCDGCDVGWGIAKSNADGEAEITSCYDTCEMRRKYLNKNNG